MIALAALSLLLSAGAPAGPSPPPVAERAACADLVLPAYPACRLTGRGIVFAGTAEEAEGAAAAANQGEAQFVRHVGPVSRYAVLVGADVAEAARILRAAGYRIVLPWLNPAARQRARDDSIRRATEAQLAGRGLSREQIEAAATQALARAGGAQPGRLLVSYSAVAHELGHMWLIDSFWRSALGGGGNAGHYGGPGPDWLDETVAVAMEDDPLTAPRRIRFRQLVRGEVPGRVASLAEFFATDHPLKGLGLLVRSGELGAAAPGAGPGAIVLTSEEATRKLGVRPEAGPNFYAQARAVADFLIERSGDPRILGDIAAALSKGRTMAQWLAGRPRGGGLGRSMADLERAWQEWTRTAYPDP